MLAAAIGRRLSMRAEYSAEMIHSYNSSPSHFPLSESDFKSRLAQSWLISTASL